MQNKNHRQNNFDLIRLLAALQVLIIHGFEHLKLDTTPIEWLQIFPGVPIFFVISGFLVSASYERSNTIYSYATNRILRIYPGLWVCFLLSLLSVFVIYQHPIIWHQAVPWIAAQLSFAQFYNPDFLRNYGVGTLNGSLWTIPVEIQFYICVPIVYFIFNRLNWKRLPIFVIFAGLIIIGQIYQTAIIDKQNIILKLIGVTAFPYLYMFILGILLQRYWLVISLFIRKKVFTLTLIYFFLAIILPKSGISVSGNQINPISAILLGIIAVGLAHTAPSLSQKTLNGNDISYGLYIYHMPIINIFVHLEKIHSYYYLGLSILLSIIFAALSWSLVEKPALKIRNMLAIKKPIHNQEKA